MHSTCLQLHHCGYVIIKATYDDANTLHLT